MAYQRSESALPYLEREKERRDKGMRDLMNMFMMQKQLGAERGEKEFERGVEREERERKFEHWDVLKDLQRAQTERAGRPDVPREPSVPAEIQAAKFVSKQTGRPLGLILQEWHKRKEAEPKKPGISKTREDFLDYLDRDINSIIKEIQSDIMYGELSPHLVEQVTNLQQAKTKIRETRLIGADQPLSDDQWKEINRISGSLEKIKGEGLYPKKKKPLVKAGLPKIKKVDLLPGTELKWNPKYNIKMGKIDGVWHWVIE